MSQTSIDIESLPKIDCSEVIGEGWYPDETRVIVNWEIEGRAETPIRINFNGLVGALKANTDTVIPLPVAIMLIDSGYDVAVKATAIVNHGADETVNAVLEQVDEAKSKIDTIAAMAVTALIATLPALTLAELRDLLIAEENGKNRTTALAAIATAIDTNPEQIALLAANEGSQGENGAGEQQSEQQEQSQDEQQSNEQTSQ